MAIQRVRRNRFLNFPGTHEFWNPQVHRPAKTAAFVLHITFDMMRAAPEAGCGAHKFTPAYL